MMSRNVIIDELHVTISVSTKLRDAQARQVRRTMLSGSFMARMRRSVLAVVRRFPTLAGVQVTLTR
jgi:hypothetical protein